MTAVVLPEMAAQVSPGGVEMGWARLGQVEDGPGQVAGELGLDVRNSEMPE